MSADDAQRIARETLTRTGVNLREEFSTHHRILSFADYLALVAAHPERLLRSSVQYMLDAMEHFGTEERRRGSGTVRRWKLFDTPFHEGRDRVVGQEEVQAAVVAHLRNFVREGRVNRLLLIHGPNGSAKSSFLAALMHALEAYSRTEEGALYRFHWVFPSERTEGSRIGFGQSALTGDRSDSYAYLEDSEIDARLAGEYNDNPLYLLPADARRAFLEEVVPADMALADVIRNGHPSPRSRQVYEALLAAHRGDFEAVMRHVQVERFFVSRHYREAAVTVEPQLRVDAGVRQLTADRSLNALPTALQNQILFEVFGPLAEGNRGMIEYNDMLKRPLDANKYLLATSEKGTVALDTGIMQLDALLFATGNETYLEAFKQQPDWPSYKGRIELVRMPYLLDWKAEQCIYDDQLATIVLEREVAPHTTRVVALWAVMTRLRRPDPKAFDEAIRSVIEALSPLDKALLYADGTLPEGLSAEQAQRLRAAIPALVRAGREGPHYEGRHGASPREMKSLVLHALRDENGRTISPLGIIAQLRALIADPSVYEWLRIEAEGGYHDAEAMVEAVRDHYLDLLVAEMRRATGLVAEAEHERVFERYITHANHWLRGEKLVDPARGGTTTVPADERFLQRLEEQLGREGEDERAFRSALLSRIASFRIDNPEGAVSLPTIFPQELERLRIRYYAGKNAEVATILRDVLRISGELDGAQEGQPDTGADGLEPAAREAAEQTLAALCERFGYTQASAREAVGFVLRERFEAHSLS